ncbi:MAG TPA: ribosome small subunit-dependent GTPase A [Thermoanaerobaculia bacterium]|nr:ribosome small subunit-dependent GTPase A [Thermoanaerobaculia bacterium]
MRVSVPKGKSRKRTRIDPREIERFEQDPDLEPDSARSRGPKDLGRSDASATRGHPVEGMVVGLYPRGCEAFADGKLLACDFAPAIRLDDENDLAVGDRVTIRVEAARSVVTAIAPRTTVLSRPDPLLKNRERVIAANVDLVVHVASVVAPPLRPGLIDRYLVAIQSGGAAPLIAVNKVDLLPLASRDAELSRLDVYRELDVPVLACSTTTREGLDALRQRLTGRTAVFVGHSGVGKSSLIKALGPEITIRIGSLRAKRRTGRHTTSRSTLYDLSNGTRVIDTPGIREFGLWQVDPGDLRFYFPEFEPHALSCRFNDCQHLEEPECAVKAAVEDRRIRPERYDAYVKLLEELRSGED